MMKLLLDIAPWPPKGFGLDMDSPSTMLWTGIVALLALALCIYGIYAYRRQNGQKASL